MVLGNTLLQPRPPAHCTGQSHGVEARPPEGRSRSMACPGSVSAACVPANTDRFSPSVTCDPRPPRRERVPAMSARCKADRGHSEAPCPVLCTGRAPGTGRPQARQQEWAGGAAFPRDTGMGMLIALLSLSAFPSGSVFTNQKGGCPVAALSPQGC